MVISSGGRAKGKYTTTSFQAHAFSQKISQKLATSSAAEVVRRWRKRWSPLRRWKYWCCCCCNWGNRGWTSLLGVLLLLLILLLYLRVQSSTSSSFSLAEMKAQLSPNQFRQLENSVKSVLATDQKLRLLAAATTAQSPNSAKNFTHPNFRADTDDQTLAAAANNNNNNASKAYGPTMKTALELVEATKVVIDVERPCGGDGGAHLELLVLVICSPGNFSRRQAIRETYGSALKRSPQTELYFILGQTEEKDDRLETQLRKESLHHNDLLQFAFTEDYYNLTLKSVAAIRWTALHCSLAAFTLKLDDDCFIRVRPLLAQLKTFETRNAEGDEGDDLSTDPADLYGLLRTDEAVVRDPAVRYAVARRYWPYARYPPFLAGVYLLRGGTTASRLYSAIVAEPTTDTLPALFIEDAYVTGLLAAKASLGIADLPGVVTLFTEEDKWEQLERAMAALEVADDNGEKEQYLIFYESLEEEDLRRFWRVFEDE